MTINAPRFEAEDILGPAVLERPIGFEACAVCGESRPGQFAGFLLFTSGRAKLPGPSRYAKVLLRLSEMVD